MLLFHLGVRKEGRLTGEAGSCVCVCEGGMFLCNEMKKGCLR